MKLLTIGTLAAFALLALPAALPAALPLATSPQVLPPTSYPHGQSYSEWSAGWWQWFCEHPLAGHPGIPDDPQFDVSSGQSGKVWYLATLLDFGPAVPRTRVIDVPAGTSLFIGLLNYEASSQEGVPFEDEQRALSNFIVDSVTEVGLSIDGQAVDVFEDYRFESPQFTFTAPDPWIFGPGGAGDFGTAVADGYYVFLTPPSVGQHTIHITGRFEFEAGVFGPDPVEFNADLTYLLNVN